MKPILFSAIIFLGVFIALLYFGGHFFQDESPTLNGQAEYPDIHLKNVKEYASNRQLDRSLQHLGLAIETIRRIEEDVDIDSGEKLEVAIGNLLNIRADINANTLSKEDMNVAIANALNTLALVELRVSETYAETNKLDKSKLALKYGLLHLEHSMKFSRGSARKQELKIYKELDSLLRAESMYPIDVTLEIAELAIELDSLLTH